MTYASWQAAVEAGNYEAMRGPLDLAIESHPARWDALNRLALAYMVQALRQMGFFAHSGDTLSAESILARGQINSTYQGLMKRWLEKLAEAGYLTTSDSVDYIAQQPLLEIDTHVILEEVRALHKDGTHMPNYMERCGQVLVNILKGVESRLDTLFPGGSYETADYLYHESSIARYFNGIARSVVESGLVAQTAGNSLRILEVGAG